MENKDYMQQNGIWEDDITRELKMKEEEEIQKQAEEKVQKMLKDGNVEMFAFLRDKEPSTLTIEEIEDSPPMLALEYSTPALTMEVETYSEDETDVDEPPPCPVHLMR
jgi:putative sterol carrier protein